MSAERTIPAAAVTLAGVGVFLAGAGFGLALAEVRWLVGQALWFTAAGVLCACLSVIASWWSIRHAKRKLVRGSTDTANPNKINLY